MEGFKTCACCKRQVEKSKFCMLKTGKLYSYCRDCNVKISRKAYRKKRGADFCEPFPRAPVGQKYCRRCSGCKPLADFYRNIATGNGYSSYCRTCEKARSHGRHLKHTYSIDSQQYEKMLEEQNGVCAICKKVESAVQFGKSPKLSVDHDHVTGRIRGLLCYACNLAVGTIERIDLRAVQHYLEPTKFEPFLFVG